MEDFSHRSISYLCSFLQPSLHLVFSNPFAKKVELDKNGKPIVKKAVVKKVEVKKAAPKPVAKKVEVKKACPKVNHYPTLMRLYSSLVYVIHSCPKKRTVIDVVDQAA